MISKSPDIRLLLEDIRSVHNAGSVFRTAETLGISRIYCAGTTPSPLDRFGRLRSDFAKVSLGAERTIGWESAARASAVVRELKKEGFLIVVLEQAAHSIDYKEASERIASAGKVLAVLGNEVDGVSAPIVGLADIVAEIPLRGSKESLNVSVAAGIALFRWFDR